jgi:hypothetical protein
MTISSPAGPDKKITLEELYILFDSGELPKTDSIEIYNGGTLLVALNGLNLSGSHNLPDVPNTFKIPAEKSKVINNGIGITIGIEFQEIDGQNLFL